MEIFTILHFTGFVFFMKFSSLVCLLWQLSFHRLIMRKIGKRHLRPSLSRYFDKTFIEMFLKQCSICDMILGLLLIFICPFEKRDVICYGVLRASVHP